ncbi:hypothetical protein GBAR_LOCUS10621 [Geodia barretti]|uniref:Uncharacterized protein n=1 Tax=Geodia barretti TaxID=519541 RepID=A0AA35RUI3_GEOBA|nr:hypothetical protein GBAR_LOCUS10621 [Geodia barretti]
MAGRLIVLLSERRSWTLNREAHIGRRGREAETTYMELRSAQKRARRESLSDAISVAAVAFAAALKGRGIRIRNRPLQ